MIIIRHGETVWNADILAHGVLSRVMRAMVLGLDDEEMNALPGGQGEIYRIENGKHSTLKLPGLRQA